MSSLRHVNLGFELVAAVVGFAAIGYWIDRATESYPRWTVIGAVLGIIGGLYNLIREALKLPSTLDNKYTPPDQTSQPTEIRTDDPHDHEHDADN